MKKIGLSLLCLSLAASSAFAQFKFTTETTKIGQVLTPDLETGVNQFDVHFNTTLPASSFTFVDPTYTFTLSKCMTQKGLQVNVYDASATPAAKVCGNFKCVNYGANGNPVRVASYSSLVEILNAYKASGSLTDLPTLPAHCLFDIDGTNQAFGAYPGIYKRVEYGFHYSFAGFQVTKDITFDIDTYFAGQGIGTATASYDLTVYIGGTADANLVATKTGFYVSGSGKKSVSLATDCGLNYAQFSNQKVYIFLKTAGSGTAIVEDGTVIDPIVVFDNFSAQYQSPFWIEPAAKTVANGTYSNQAAPYVGVVNQEGVGIVNLQTKGRVGTFTITNDYSMDTYASKQISFLATGGVKAKDGDGKYTIDVPYTFTPGGYNDLGALVKEVMLVAAPASGASDDDIQILFTVKPRSTTSASNSIELNCGVRIYYNFFASGAISNAIGDVKNNEVSVYSNDGKIYIANAEGEVEIKSITGQVVALVSSDIASKGVAVKSGLYLVTVGNTTSKVLVK